MEARKIYKELPPPTLAGEVEEYMAEQ